MVRIAAYPYLQGYKVYAHLGIESPISMCSERQSLIMLLSSSMKGIHQLDQKSTSTEYTNVPKATGLGDEILIIILTGFK